MKPAIEDLDALEDLIEALEAAPHGDRQLDLRIEYCVGVLLEEHIDLAGLMIEEGFSWEHVVEALDCKVPFYTSSLDAALESEAIVFVMRSNKRDQWGAIHRAKTGVETLAWAASEALARRAAPLKALVAEGRRREALAFRSEPPGRKPVAAAVSGMAHADEPDIEAIPAAEVVKPLREAGDWKILF